ncbi:adenylate kinase [Candidatus Oleimmundimicrobium sp.]|uniref:adenylate kinase n=1 Tax=Candidatus Oleimmundimicrobium sp. TaxID=3060597 RepID=UPI00280A7EBE|nr:adenylate kinase [Candidatus Oleimmundimicrobium sp.]
MNIILLGAPGAGKGTQAKVIAKKYNMSHISTGDMLRLAVANKTKLGIKAKEYMDKGELVPDEVVVGIVKDRLLEEDCKRGFILDGFPRTVAQSDALKRALAEAGKKIDVALSINVSEDELVKRLTGRRSCKNCGKVYHLIFNPPKIKGLCDICGKELYQRDDDTVETVKNRLEVYRKQTAPLIDYYKDEGILKTINGEKPIADVECSVIELLAELM